MTIGVLKEGDGENRVVLLPEHVASLVKKEFSVQVEKGAGLSAFASDESYTEAGATIRSRAEKCYSASMHQRKAFQKGKS